MPAGSKREKAVSMVAGREWSRNGATDLTNPLLRSNGVDHVSRKVIKPAS